MVEITGMEQPEDLPSLKELQLKKKKLEAYVPLSLPLCFAWWCHVSPLQTRGSHPGAPCPAARCISSVQCSRFAQGVQRGGSGWCGTPNAVAGWVGRCVSRWRPQRPVCLLWCDCRVTKPRTTHSSRRTRSLMKRTRRCVWFRQLELVVEYPGNY